MKQLRMSLVDELHIDGDLFIYRVGFACNDESLTYAQYTMDRMIGAVLLAYPETPYKIYLTGSGIDNYRHNYAITAQYKGNRKGTEKPIHYEALRNYLLDTYDTDLSDGNEADDTISIAATSAKAAGRLPCIVSVDKDFDQIAGLRYDFVKEVEVWKTTEEAKRNLYRQVMEGDVADNIKGLRGVGPVKAKAILKDMTDAKEMYEACIATWMERTELTKEEATARVVENLNLLFLQREYGVYWKEPA